MDGDHTVSREELQVAVEKNCKRSISLAEIEGILSKADLNQSGALDFGEFLVHILENYSKTFFSLGSISGNLKGNLI